MTTVAVTGASSPIGKALLERLDADDAVDRIIGIDEVEPEMPVAKLEYRPSDVRDRLLAVALDGADVVVHLALDLTPQRAEDTHFARNVHGTRNVLAATAAAEASALVHLSTALAYGAHPDNPLPLREDAPLRANPDYAPAYHALLAEELVGEFAVARPGTRVAVLRPVAMLGHGAGDALTQRLEAPRIPGVRGYHPPTQVVHLDDVAVALHLAATGDLSGAYNVAADGWLAVDELCGLLGKRLVEVPETLMFPLVHALWTRDVWPVPAGAVHFLMHPLVLSSAKLHAAGWTPTRTNREVLREFAAEHAGWVRLGTARLQRRSLGLGAGAAVTLAVGMVLIGRALRR
jgi:UDP-glucose 4-epimerase